MSKCTPNNIHAYGYVRVSTKKQVFEGLSLELQKQRIREFCEERGFQLINIIADEGKSGASIKKRQNFVKLIKKLDQNDYLVCTSWCRITRNARDAQDIAAVVALKRFHMTAIDTPAAIANLQYDLEYSILNVINEYNRHLISKRTQQAMKRKKNQGLYTGGKPPYGYTVAPDQSLKAHIIIVLLSTVRSNMLITLTENQVFNTWFDSNIEKSGDYPILLRDLYQVYKEYLSTLPNTGQSQPLGYHKFIHLLRQKLKNEASYREKKMYKGMVVYGVQLKKWVNS